MSINYPNYLIRVKYLKAITEGPGLRVPYLLNIFSKTLGVWGIGPS